ncbi:hypothetical protein KM043_000698 [Ampulex compressa]|nr:hypothetical protein KM043_000698 [Ampulex compressa]
MEIENTSKGVATRLLASDTTEFNAVVQENSENDARHEDSFLSIAKELCDNGKGNITCAQLKDTAFPADVLERAPTTKIEKQEGSDDHSSNIEDDRFTKDKKVSGNECKADRSKNISDTCNNPSTPAPLAFTIDFGNNKEVDAAKYQNLFERYNARHKRNLSMSKVDSNTKKSNTPLSPNLAQRQKIPSIHSDGYYNSEDDTKRKTDHLTEKLKQLGTKSYHNPETSEAISRAFKSQNKEDLMTRSYDERPKCNKLTRQNLSSEFDYTTKSKPKPYRISQKSVTINDLSSIQTSNYDADNIEKSYTKNIEPFIVDNINDNFGHICENVSEKVSNISHSLDNFDLKNSNVRESNLSSISYTMELNVGDTNDTSLDIFNVSNTDAGSDEAVSEAGTYTIHKDYTDKEKARMDIDKVFSVGVLTEDESNEAYVHSFKMSISRDHNTWISEWATQVAEHNSLPPVVGGATGRTPPLSPSKIPSPIHSRIQRMSRSRNEQSDSSLDAESYLRIKERIGLASHQHILVDSGGESDDDTSNSYYTPPNSSQRTPVHSTLARRGSLSESLFRRINTSDTRRSLRKYLSSSKSKTEDINAELPKSPSHEFSSLHLGRRSSSLDRKEFTSDTNESNTSRRNNTKYYREGESKHTNSPVLNRFRPSTPKLTNSPVVACKTSTKIINSPVSERTKHLTKSSPQAKNIGYFTCIENSPYMLRKSNSTTSYHEASVPYNVKETCTRTTILQNSPHFQHNLSIQRSCSNANIGNTKSQSMLSHRSGFNSSDMERSSTGGRCLIASDSSSETGEQHTKAALPAMSSGVKLNRAFSIRRARLNGESDTTNTTPEERRRTPQTDAKSTILLNKQQSHRSRASSAGVHSRESLQKVEPTKPRAPSISRTDSGRFSMRTQKPTHHNVAPQRPNQKVTKDHKKSGRSNSSLTSKEVEFQNWKRRKSYDPMKAAAEGRKKLMDGTKKHHSTEDSSENHDNSVLRSASFHGTGGALSLANDWSDNELNYSQDDNQIPPPCSPQLESDSDLETSFYWQTTQNVVSAMSARITVSHSPLADSDSESDEDTSRSLRQNVPKVMRRPSDTESSDDRQPVMQSRISNTKYNRAFNLRKARLEPPQTKSTILSTNKNKVSRHDVHGKPEAANRTDSGRSSMRLGRISSNSQKSKAKEVKKPATPNAREVEMQNWKRRKSYDPMKAAMEGKKKAGLAKKNVNASLSPRTDSDR